MKGSMRAEKSRLGSPTATPAKTNSPKIRVASIFIMDIAQFSSNIDHNCQMAAIIRPFAYPQRSADRGF